MAATAGYWGPEAILYSTNGDPAKSVGVQILDAETGLPAVLYTDVNKTDFADNPTKTDGFGNLSFYADPGFYRVRLVSSGHEFLTEVIVSGSGGGGGTGPVEYEHVQLIAQAVWTVNHALGRRPAAVSLFSMDYGEQYDEFSVQHLDANNLLISMDVPTAGRALM